MINHYQIHQELFFCLLLRSIPFLYLKIRFQGNKGGKTQGVARCTRNPLGFPPLVRHPLSLNSKASDAYNRFTTHLQRIELSVSL